MSAWSSNELQKLGCMTGYQDSSPTHWGLYKMAAIHAADIDKYSFLKYKFQI